MVILLYMMKFLKNASTIGSIVDIALEQSISHKTVLNHLHKAGYKKLDVWVSDELSAKIMIDRINTWNTMK